MSEEAKDQLFGDLETEPQPEPEEAPAPATAEEPTEAVEVPEELATDPKPDTSVDEDVLPAPGEAEASQPDEEEVPEPALDEVPPLGEDETWKKRYADLRSQEMPALAEARQRAEFAEQQLATFISQQSAATISPERLQELTQRAEEAGLDPAQVGIYADITSEAVKAREQAMQQTLQAQAERARQEQFEAENAQRAQVYQGFEESHPDLTDDGRTSIARFLHDIEEAVFIDRNTGTEIPYEVPFEQKVQMGVLQPKGALNPEVLNFAYHAVVENPALGQTLTAMPQLMDTEDGMNMAYRLASQIAPPTATTRPDTQAIDESLANAATLGGPSAPAPAEQEDIFIKSGDKFFSK